MKQINRREFLKFGSAALVGLLLPKTPASAYSGDYEEFGPPPASLGRIATWWNQGVRKSPSPTADWVVWKSRDEIIPLLAAVVGEAPWPTNPIWYQTSGGFIHSGYVQPVEDRPQAEVVTDVHEPGFWAQVCVPFAESRWQPGSPYVSRKLYYETVYRVVGAKADDDGKWWYQLLEGITWSPGPYVPAWSVRRIQPEELAPISPGRTDKWIQINIQEQTLDCYEGERAVFSTRIGSGLGGTATPRGEFRVLYKHYTRRMIGDDYDLPGVAFPVYFTRSGVAIHGTYWHNDYGRRHSHGCVNVTSTAAAWVFRWVDPVAPYTAYTQDAEPDKGTPIIVV